MKVKEVAQAASLPLGSVSMAAAYRFVDLRVQELLSLPIKPLRKTYELVIPAIINTGTVSVTSGTRTVTGNSAAQTAWASKEFVERYFRTDDDNPWHKIAYVSGTTLQLVTEYTGDTVTDGGYTIAARFRPLADRVRRVGAVVNMTHGITLVRRSQEDLDRLVPRRSTVKGGPVVYSELGQNDEGRKLIEFYPFHDSDVFIVYTGYERPPNLQPNDELPDYIDPWMIQEGVKMDQALGDGGQRGVPERSRGQRELPVQHPSPPAYYLERGQTGVVCSIRSHGRRHVYP